MKNTLILVLFPLFAIGVFGVELKSVSVNEGDSVTLHTGVQIQGSDEVEWLLKGKLIFIISSSASAGITVTNKTNGAFGGRLKVDEPSGDLEITNFKTTDSGEYELKISSTRGSSDTTFNVTGVSDPDPVKFVTVGESITLNTQKKSDEEIWWRFKAENTSMTKINLMVDRNTVDYDVLDGIFRDRLKLNEKTGSLNITNITYTHSGVYEADISSSVNSFTIHKTFTVTVEGVQSVPVIEGDFVSLHTGVTKIQRDDEILWKFGDQDVIIARLNGPDVSYKWSNVNVNKQTGDLNISDIQSRQSGDYKVQINTINVISCRKYHINIIGKLVMVMEGDSVTLHTGTTKIQKDDAVLWFGDQALITRTGSVGPRWKNTEKDDQTGDLTIRNIRRDQSGDYKVKFIKSSITTVPRKFHINITGVFSSETDGVKTVTVKNGESVFLNTLVTEIQQADLMEWLFGPQNIIIAKTDGKSNSPSYTNNDERFENRLNLDIQTGNLTIEHSSRGDSGLYQLKIIKSTFTIQKRFRVTVSGLSRGEIAGIVSVLVLLAAVGGGVMIYLWKKSKAKQRKIIEVNGQSQEETELNKPTESVENQ